MKKIILGLLTIFAFQQAMAQKLDWVINEVQDSSAVSTANNYIIVDEAIFDADSNILSIGLFRGEVDFDPTSGVDIRESKYTPASTAYSQCAFIKKTDQLGNIIWLRVLNSNSFASLYDIALDQDGNIYVAGAYSGLLKSNLGGTLNSQNTMTTNALVMKLDNLGNVLWQESFGGTDFSEKGSGIALDTFGYVYVTGTYNTKYNFTTGAQLSTAGKNRAYVLQLGQSDGSVIGLRGFGSTDLNETSQADGLDIAIDYSSQTTFPLIILAGRFTGTADFRLNFHPSHGPDIRNATDGELFILKFNSTPADTNNFWTNFFDDYNLNDDSSLKLDADKNVYFAHQEVVYKYSSTGSFLWRNSTTNGRIQDFDLSQEGLVYTVGSFTQSNHNFNGTLNQPPYYCNIFGGGDAFIRKIDTTGRFIWARTLGSTGVDKIHTILISDTSFFITGRFADTTDFELGNDTFNLEKPTNISIGAFLAKYTIAENIVDSSSVVACNSYQVNGQTFYNSTVQTVIYNDYSEIDSVVVLDITINDNSTSTLNIANVCDSIVINNQTFTSAGTFTQVLTNAVGCDSTITINITNFNTRPTINLSISTNETVCSGTQISCTATGYSSYNWSVSSSLTNTINTSFTSVGTSLDTMIIVTGGATGCRNSDTVFLTINPIPEVIITGDFAICNGESTTITASGATSYSWSTGASDPSIVLSPAATGNYLLTSTLNGCNSVETVQIQVTNYPNLNVTNNVTICPGESTTISVSGAASYLWDNGLGTVQSASVTPSSSTTYTVIGTTNECSTTDQVTVTLNQAAPTFEVINLSVCDSYAWDLNNETYTASGTYTHVGSTAQSCEHTTTLNLTINNSSSETVSETACNSYIWEVNGESYTASGTYTHIGTNAAGCDSISTLNLTINTIDASTSLDGTTIIANQSDATYQWLDCDNGNVAISGETNQTFTATENGNFAVSITKNNCTEISECVAISSVGLNEGKLSTFEIFPNPTSGTVKINLGANDSKVKIKVFNSLGQIITTKNVESTNEFTLEIEGESGVYILEIETSEEVKSRMRVVKK
jgi:hypothetical protein